MRLSESVREGHYVRKQMLCKDRLISWSHSRRFEVGLELARSLKARRVLDYGCGDGAFLSLLMAEAGAPESALGVEIEQRLVDDCRARLEEERLRFALVDELISEEHCGAYDLVVCAEVLEHVVGPERTLDRLAWLLHPDGRLVISVPVETGFPLIVKQAVRRMAGWRGLGDYPGSSPYTTGELWRGVFAGARQHIGRPVHPGSTPFHCHKGFNWMALRLLIAERFEIERSFGSPLTWLPPHLASQAWFVARRK